MAAALAAKVLPFGLFETRRLVGAAIGIIGLLATWRIGRRLGGPVAGLTALVLLATCPLYYGHMFMNAKDAPFAAAMAVLLLGLVRAFDEYPKPGVRTVALVGVGLGLAFGSRILAGIAAPTALVALLVIVIGEVQASGLRKAATRLGEFIWCLLPALALGYLIMGLLWPWSIVSPLNPLHAAEYFDTFFEKPWRELFAGQLIPVTEMPVRYLPQLFVLKLPEIMIALGLAGAIGALVAATRPDCRHPAAPISCSWCWPLFSPWGWRCWRTLPSTTACATSCSWCRPLRCSAASPAVGCSRKPARSRRASRSQLRSPAGIALPVSDMVRLHPYQYSAFNWASGGVRMAHDNYMLDYWGLAFKQAGEALRVKINAMHLKPPRGRRWTIEICGPQPPAEVALGPDFETTWDRKRADFAMMLGTFYCRDDLKAPVLVEIKREGVDYARVYDIRGRAVPNLLTEPPP